MNRYFKAAVATVIALAGSTLTASAQTQPRDRNCFHHRHFNVGGVCLLSSYGFLLEYANSTDEHVADFDNFDMMAQYMVFHGITDPCPQHSAAYFRANQKEAEQDMSDAINNYCIARGWSGYIRVLEFHNWLKLTNNWADNIEFVLRAPNAQKSNGKPLANGYAELARYLERNADPNSEYDYAALICFPTASGPHSVFLGYDGDYFIRDVNHVDRYADKSCSFGYTYGPDADVLEYAIYKVKRKGAGSKEWKHYSKQAFSTTNKEGDNFMVLDKPIPVKHLRVTDKAKGANGAPEYTVIKLRSYSDPGFELIYGNYYGMPTVSINGKYAAIGHRTPNGTYEFDLGQIADDLYIWGYQPNFNFEKLSYQ